MTGQAEPQGSLAVGMYWSILAMLGVVFSVMFGIVVLIVRAGRVPKPEATATPHT